MKPFPPDPPAFSWATRLCATAAFTLLALALAWFSYRLSLTVGKSSDQANLLLAGVDMLHGNWRLHGWFMVPDSYWTLDVALGALLSGLRQLAGLSVISPSTLVLQPALSWTALCLFAILVSQRGLSTMVQRLSASLVVLATVAIPVLRGAALPLVMLSGIHILSILTALIAFVLAQRVVIGAAWRVALAGYVVILLLGCIGDPLLLFVAVMPVLLSLPFASSVSAGRRLALACGTVLAAGAASGLLALNAATGGYAVTKLPFFFANFSDLATNAGVTLHCLAALFSGDFGGLEVRDAVPELIHLPLLVLAVAALAWWLNRVRLSLVQRQFGSIELLTLCLCFGAVIDIAALIASPRVEYENFSLTAARYVFPAWIFMTILLARRVSGSMAMRTLCVTALASALLFDWTVMDAPSYDGAGANEHDLLLAIEARPEAVGLAGYWEAGLLRVASRGALRVEAVAIDGAAHVSAFDNVHKAFSVGELTSRDFFVVVRRPRLYFGVDDVVRAFGPPAHVEERPLGTILWFPARRG